MCKDLLLFYSYGIFKAIFNRLNLHSSQKGDSLVTFLNKLCSNKKKTFGKGFKVYIAFNLIYTNQN